MAKYTRSRNGCKACKAFKIKCDEQKPRCQNCIRRGLEYCDYSKVLQWGGRPCRKKSGARPEDGVLFSSRRAQKPPSAALVQELAKAARAAAAATAAAAASRETIETSVDHEVEQATPSDQSVVLADQSMDIAESWQSLSSLPTTSLVGSHLPSPMPDILLSSPYYMELFEFYLKETCNFLVPLPRELYSDNPFYQMLPQMAMRSPTLLYLLLAFGANHKNMMAANCATEQVSLLPLEDFYVNCSTDSLVPVDLWQACVDPQSPVNVSVTDKLLTKTFNQLLANLMNAEERTSDSTLATIMMLAAFDIFFSDKRRKWRAHVYGAGRLIMERLCDSGSNMLTISDEGESNDLFFITRWFSYVDIIGSLSSTSKVITSEKLRAIKYKFEKMTDQENWSRRRINLKDIEAGTGLEAKVLSYLADVSWLIREREQRQDANGGEITQKLLSQVLELDYEINAHLNESERERDEIFKAYYSQGRPEIYKGYRILRATNLIFGLTGSFQLKRRVLNLPQNSRIIEDSLVKITKLVDESIPLVSSSTSCIIFCLFCCGCELLSDSMVKYRPVYMKRIDSLNRKGVSSAAMAKRIMEKCWNEKKFWWDILRENNLDITFAI